MELFSFYRHIKRVIFLTAKKWYRQVLLLLQLNVGDVVVVVVVPVHPHRLRVAVPTDPDLDLIQDHAPGHDPSPDKRASPNQNTVVVKMDLWCK